MRVAGSNRFFINPGEEETLDRMSRDDEMSDGGSSESLEEISADAFKRRDDIRGSRSRVWMEVPRQRNYSPHLYNFAWAQAVQNKPLGFEVSPMGSVEIVGDGEKGVKEDPCDVVIEDSSENVGGEKEEGELEEGEIGFGSDVVAPVTDVDESNEPPPDADESNGKEDIEVEVEEMGEFDKSVSLILEELDAITVEEVEKSFEASYLRLLKCFESLKQMSSDEHTPVVDALVQQAFISIQTLHSVYSSGNLKNMDQAEKFLVRLLMRIKNQYHVLLNPEQMKEIDVLVQTLVFENSNKEKEMKMNVDRSGSAKLAEKPVFDQRKPSFPNLELPVTPRNRVLVDLHAKYDEGSLPSPTRDNPQPLPMLQPIGVGVSVGATTPSQPIASKNVNADDTSVHPYLTDALKAVSSYQQKYSKTTFLQSNRLPSPTPSEDGKNNDDDTRGEVSSSSVSSHSKSTNSTSSSQDIGSSSSNVSMMNLTVQPVAPTKTVVQMSCAPNSVMKSAAKSRDPRLKFVNAEVGDSPDQSKHTASLESTALKNGPVGALVNTRKHKVLDEPLLDDHHMKRRRNGVSDPRDVLMTSGRGGWLGSSSSMSAQPNSRIYGGESVDVQRKPGNGEIVSDRRPDACMITKASNNAIELNSILSTAAAVSLPNLLKGIAVNPTMLVELLKMEQQRLAGGAQQKPADAIQNSAINRTAAVPSLSIASLNSAELGQRQAGKSQMPAQTIPTNIQTDTSKIRMKPRDPRRILHNNLAQAALEQTKSTGNLSTDGLMNKDLQRVGEQGEQAQTTTLLPHSTSRPDVLQQLTSNPRNNADSIPSSQTTTPLLTVLPQSTPQPNMNKISKVDIRPSSAESNDQKSGSISSSDGVSDAAQASNPWGDVEHLLDGYDDHQKAAIQKERARRIEEQNKMFASRKLCLVLDLDHTLLNSAKFTEVDPIHDEILRKKEEQDREKAQRHLFRLHHMGMWTKLRPGIWNFLEKASKLYELHLYTMGNKLYATEMAKVLDPTGTLFSGRVISRGDDGDPVDGDERAPRSKDLEGVLGMESAVVIIDDSIRVWPHNKLNLIVVERYTYFPCSRRQFGLLGPSLLEIDHDERPEDGTLASSLGVIERIHQNFFSNHSLDNVDVRNILASEQRKILAGCRIVFSRVFPVGEANPHMHPLWQTAEQFGASCTNQVDDRVTHVVANSLGTDKVNWALSTARFVVHPGWVEASALLYRRANEHDFAVKI
ncbi:RNA polymerase II C-terminal domain phosphatase-like 3 [Dioscorea cayenensis subsp. rotundata]|uniref:protein-serine/threonine phosphatase n=1 Tax=Dioscorea cayennensis subsp. rotundata TaxID=55577 RepID=A0AB40BBP9_DIOCR|nr:RNA polymerase II C-terminal domain phosphatase-like 3 [Dioscorea cayenensis subsp. rotundata]